MGVNVFTIFVSTSGLHYKSFTIIIYDCNDSALYYETMILANLALARSVNYDCKVRCNLKHTL
jgi:hypothetical protein